MNNENIIQETTTGVLQKTVIIKHRKEEESSFIDKTTKEKKVTPEHFRIIVDVTLYGKNREAEIKLTNNIEELDNFDFNKIKYKPVSLNNILVSSMVKNGKIVKYYRMDIKDIKIIG